MILLSYVFRHYVYRMVKTKFSTMAGWFRAPESGSMAGTGNGETIFDFLFLLWRHPYSSNNAFWSKKIASVHCQPLKHHLGSANWIFWKCCFFFYTLKSCVSYLGNLIKIPDISELYSLKYNVFCLNKKYGNICDINFIIPPKFNFMFFIVLRTIL